MSHVVCEPCLGCRYTDCVAVCPVDCFRESDRRLVILPDGPGGCIDCELCVPECPVNAILRDIDVPTGWEVWIEINAREAPTLPVVLQSSGPLPGAPPRPSES